MHDLTAGSDSSKEHIEPGLPEFYSQFHQLSNPGAMQVRRTWCIALDLSNNPLPLYPIYIRLSLEATNPQGFYTTESPWGVGAPASTCLQKKERRGCPDPGARKKKEEKICTYFSTVATSLLYGPLTNDLRQAVVCPSRPGYLDRFYGGAAACALI